MLLVVDVGNTNIVLGVYEESKLLYDWRIATQKDRTSDEYGMIFDQIFRYHGVESEKVTDVIISSVVPTLMHTLSAMTYGYFGFQPMVVGAGIKTGMNIKVDNPKEVGADRIVNAVAGFEKYGGPLIIVDSGTAITIDVISESGDYLGGAIAPGIRISSDALFIRTAKLPKVEIVKPERVIGKNTEEGLRSGIIYGYVGLVDFIIEKMLQEMNWNIDQVKVLSTGGFSSMLASESKYIHEVDRLLTLEGLRIIYERNVKK